MSNPSPHPAPASPSSPKPAKPVFKFLGMASNRTWKEVRADLDADSAGADMMLAPKVFEDELRGFLETRHLLVLAGSGTSLGEAVNGPSMDKLWRAIKKQKGFVEASRAVRHPEADENFESLLARCRSALQFMQGAVKTIVEEFVGLAEQEIHRECSDFLQTADLGAHKEFLRRLTARAPALPRLRLFTTNYDRCFEQAAGALGYPVVDGFSYAVPRHFAAHFFGYDFVRRDPAPVGREEYVENVFHLLKLHGSVDWEVRAGGIVLNEQPATRCLIYPVNATLEPAHTQPYLEITGQFLAALRQPHTALLAVGFGFADEHLLRPIRAAVEANSSLKLWVVDRACEGKTFTPGAFQELLKKRIALQDDRIALINGEFEQFVERIPGPTRTPPEEKLARLKEELKHGRSGGH
jgi:hypothetical protein